MNRNKTTSDSKVKKTLIRNYELKVKPAMRKQVVYDVACSSNSTIKSCASEKENELSQPSLCSSGALANYLEDLKKSVPPQPLSTEDLNIDKGHVSAKVTKKLNFHFNDKMYKNLIELNGSIEEFKSKRDKRPSSSTISSSKRDLEPNIEDFYEDENEIDSPPHIPVQKPKFKPIRRAEDGYLHQIVSEFENL